MLQEESFERDPTLHQLSTLGEMMTMSKIKMEIYLYKDNYKWNYKDKLTFWGNDEEEQDKDEDKDKDK